MEEVKMVSALSAETPMVQDACGCEGEKCEHSLAKSGEEMSLAVLVAMVPLLVFTLFGQVGLL